MLATLSAAQNNAEYVETEIATLLKNRDFDIELIKQYGIKNIYYTTDNGWCYERIE